MSRIFVSLPTVLFASVALTIASCSPIVRSTGKSVLTTVVDGRKIVATVPSPSSIQQVDGHVVVMSGSRKLMIEKDRVNFAGEELAKIPADAKELQLTIDDAGLLTINAAGVEIGSKKLP